MPYVSIDDFQLGMDVRKPRVSGTPGSLFRLKNAFITRGGDIERTKKFVSKYNLPVLAGETNATGAFSVTGGTESSGVNQVTSITINGVDILGAAVDFVTNNTATAAAVAAQINSVTSSVNYAATSSGETVFLTADAGVGASVNGVRIITAVAGDVTISGDPYWNSSTKTVLLLEGLDGAQTTTDSAAVPHIYTFASQPEIDTAQFKFGASSALFNDPANQTDGRIHAPASADWAFGGGEFTVECWARFTTAALSEPNVVLSQWSTGSGNLGWTLGTQASGLLQFFYTTDGINTISVNSATGVIPNADQWYHLAAVRSGTEIILFVDGVMVKTQDISTDVIFDPGNTFNVGAHANNNASGMDGHIDEVRITKGAARYCGVGFTPPTSTIDLATTNNNARMECGVAIDEKTFGMHAQGGNLFVFGGFTEPSGIPSGVTYQRLRHKDNPTTTQIRKILDTENFDGKIYAIAEYTDGAIYHFYDGARVTSWDDIAAAVSSNNTVASAFQSRIDLHADFVATVLTDTVTIEAAVAGVGFTISATAQNFGSVNNQKITLTQTVANSALGSEVLATGTVTVTGGTPNTAAVGSFNLASGAAGSVDSVTVNSVEAMSGAEAFDTDLSTTATNVAANITAHTSAPNYTAVAVGTVVTITALQSAGADPNTFVVLPTGTTITFDTIVNMAGGVTNALTALTVDGVSVIASRVNYAPEGSNSETATDVAAAITAHTSSPDYTATASGNVVTITALAGTGAGPNGFVVSRTVAGDLTAGTTNMQGGSAGTSAVKEKWTAQITGTFEPADVFTITLNGEDFTVQGAGSGTGTTALTFKKKVYSTAASLMFFSGINNPTVWEQVPDTENATEIGSGFINFSTQDSGSESLHATGIYQGNIAVYAEGVTQIQFVDVDENANTHLHTVRNSGTRSPHSVVQFGNNNLFYLDELSGIRSLRARDSSNAPEMDDVGSAIDEHVLDYLDSITEQEAADAVGIIADEGRYWLAVKNRFYIFSFFKRSKVSAWSFAEPNIGDITALARIRRKIYARALSTIYLYGGDDGTTYPSADEDVVEVELPFLDLDKAAHKKTLESFDFAALNDWQVSILIDPDDLNVASGEFTLSNTTYTDDAVGGLGLRSSHFAPKLVCSAAGKAALYSLAIHYKLDPGAA